MDKDAQRDIPTEALVKNGGVMVRIGSHRLAIPAATIILAVMTALGTAYQVVKSDRAEIINRINALERCDENLSRKLELEQVVLAEIRTQLARIDARVAEVQVTLMRGGGR